MYLVLLHIAFDSDDSVLGNSNSFLHWLPLYVKVTIYLSTLSVIMDITVDIPSDRCSLLVLTHLCLPLFNVFLVVLLCEGLYFDSLHNKCLVFQFWCFCFVANIPNCIARQLLHLKWSLFLAVGHFFSVFALWSFLEGIIQFSAF